VSLAYRDGTGSSNPAAWQILLIGFATVVWSLLMLRLCWQYGATDGDYQSYLRQWQLVLDGDDPWSTNNRYGPLHNVIAFLVPWGPLAPKFFMVGVLLIANAALVLNLLRERGLAPIQLIYLLAIPTNLLVVGVGGSRGLNDSVVAALLVFAVLFRHRSHFLATGVFVGLAALLKYYPILLLPFFALNGKERTLHWSVIASGASVFFLGLGLAVAIWGKAPLVAIWEGSDRPPKILSILASLGELYGRYGRGIVPWLIGNNTYFVVGGAAAALLFAWKACLNWLEGVVLGFFVVLVLYKVGHEQFYVPWLFMVASLPLVNTRSADRMAIIFLPAVLLLSLYEFYRDSGYVYYEYYSVSNYRYELEWLKTYGRGLIAFFVSIASIAVYVVYLWKSGSLAELRASVLTPIALFRERKSGKVPIIISIGSAIIAAVTHNGFGILMVGYLILLISNLLWDVRPKLKRADTAPAKVLA
jgi:Glycosyltransferase family 87